MGKRRIHARKKRHTVFAAASDRSSRLFEAAPSSVQTKKETSSITSQSVPRRPVAQAQQFGHSLGKISVFANDTADKPSTTSSYPLTVQPKLTLGKPNDVYEQEADQVSEQVVEQINQPVEAANTARRKERRKHEAGIQNFGAVSSTQHEGKVSIQTEQPIEQKRGSGKALSNDMRESAKEVFGADFSGVIQHARSKPKKTARKLTSKPVKIKARKSTHGISEKDVKILRTKRPLYASGQVEAVWNAAPKDDMGKAICPNSGKLIQWAPGQSREGVWDMGHKTGHEYKTLWQRLASGKIRRDEFMAEYQNPDNYQVEDASTNRSHAFEAS